MDTVLGERKQGLLDTVYLECVLEESLSDSLLFREKLRAVFCGDEGAWGCLG